MHVHDELGKRIKEYYEQIPKIKLMRRCPVVVRIDGRAFHSFTRGFKKPFDEILIKSMQETMKYLCENIQGCVLGYHQSDEISLLLIDYKTLDSQAFFDYEVQKICSITASMATMAFNKYFHNNAFKEINRLYEYTPDDVMKYKDTLRKAIEKGAMFDCRCFNIPKEECTNYFYWRELDAIRNSIQMVGQANFSHKELQNKTCSMIKDMLYEQRNINWDDLSTTKKRGSCCIKINEFAENSERTLNDSFVVRRRWIIDNDIPIFVNEGRDYIEQRF